MKTIEMTADYSKLCVGIYTDKTMEGFKPSASQILETGFIIGIEKFTAGLLPLSETNPQGFSNAEARHLLVFFKQNTDNLDKNLKIAATGTMVYGDGDGYYSPYIYFSEDKNIWTSWQDCFDCCLKERIKEGYYKLVTKKVT